MLYPEQTLWNLFRALFKVFNLSLEQAMQVTKFQPKKIAPLQYLLRQLNSEAGLVAPGWGTTLLMSILMFLFFCFLLIILQIANGSILLEGVNVDWSSLNQVPSAETTTTAEQSFASTAIGVFSGLLVFVIGCIAFIAYGASTYPSDKA